MKEILAQFDGKLLRPYSIQDEEDVAGFKPNQLVSLKITGAEKARSAPQLRLFWACCAEVAANTENRSWNDREKVALQVKVALNFIDMNKSIVDPQGNFHPHYRSISFKNLKAMEACRFFDQAFEVLANQLGVSVEQLLRNSGSAA